MKRLTTSIPSLAGRNCLVIGMVGALVFFGTTSFAQSDDANPRCVKIGGTIMTNFISENATLGSATGDLRGAVNASILSVTPGRGDILNFQVQHRWVTETGDIIFFEPAEAVATPIGPGVFGVTYDHVNITGGTGKFRGATGTLKIFGAADLGRKETVFRYDGRVCFNPSNP